MYQSFSHGRLPQFIIGGITVQLVSPCKLSLSLHLLQITSLALYTLADSFISVYSFFHYRLVDPRLRSRATSFDSTQIRSIHSPSTFSKLSLIVSRLASPHHERRHRRKRRNLSWLRYMGDDNEIDCSAEERPVNFVHVSYPLRYW